MIFVPLQVRSGCVPTSAVFDRGNHMVFHTTCTPSCRLLLPLLPKRGPVAPLDRIGVPRRGFQDGTQTYVEVFCGLLDGEQFVRGPSC